MGILKEKEEFIKFGSTISLKLKLAVQNKIDDFNEDKNSTTEKLKFCDALEYGLEQFLAVDLKKEDKKIKK